MDHAVTVGDDSDFDVERVQARLRVTEAIERALTDLDVVAAVYQCADIDAATAMLQDAPFGFPPFEASHVLDVQIRRFTAQQRDMVAQEVATLVGAIEQRKLPAPPAPRSPQTFARMFTPPATVGPLQRLVPGPAATARFAHGDLQVIAIEVYRDAAAVLWRHELLDPDQTPLGTFGMAPRVSDDLGTDYATWDLVSGGQHAERFGRLRMLPAPLPDARRLDLAWGNAVLSVEL
jgi:hypothetical protein